jgi:hypothetical protein
MFERAILAPVPVKIPRILVISIPESLRAQDIEDAEYNAKLCRIKAEREQKLAHIEDVSQLLLPAHKIDRDESSMRHEVYVALAFRDYESVAILGSGRSSEYVRGILQMAIEWGTPVSSAMNKLSTMERYLAMLRRGWISERKKYDEERK